MDDKEVCRTIKQIQRIKLKTSLVKLLNIWEWIQLVSVMAGLVFTAINYVWGLPTLILAYLGTEHMVRKYKAVIKELGDDDA